MQLDALRRNAKQRSWHIATVVEDIGSGPSEFTVKRYLMQSGVETSTSSWCGSSVADPG